eukprot:NODE_1_length_95616_cov_0.657642.p42 type:complete len:242 gc:universal NODE_1_length_95616_cov_0.657642:33959-34684(+)
MKLRTIQRILGKLGNENKSEKFSYIQSIYVNNKWPIEFKNAKDHIKELESNGLYKCSAICRYYSADVTEKAELIDSAYRLKALDDQDLQESLKYLVENEKENKYCSYVIGSMLINKHEEKGLGRLKFAMDEVEHARDLYCQVLIKRKKHKEVLELLTALPKLTAKDKFWIHLAEKDKLKSIAALVESAELGLRDAQYNLGCAYLDDQLNGGIPEAQSWFYLAAFQGHPNAIKNLEKFMQKT